MYFGLDRIVCQNKFSVFLVPQNGEKTLFCIFKNQADLLTR